MTTFKELCGGKVWKAIEAMISGLEEQSLRNDFLVNMYTFGERDINRNMCYGCAATCAIQKIVNVCFDIQNISKTRVKASISNVSYDDYSEFETAIDSVRYGNLVPLMEYMGVPFEKQTYYTRYLDTFRLESANWKRQIPTIERILVELKADDV